MKLGRYTVDVKVYDHEGNDIGSISMRSANPDDPTHVAVMMTTGIFEEPRDVVGFWTALAESAATAWKDARAEELWQEGAT